MNKKIIAIIGVTVLLLGSSFSLYYLLKLKNSKDYKTSVDALIAQKQYAEVLKIMKRAKAENLEEKEFICSRRGLAFFALKKYQEAFEAYQQCAELMKENAPKKSSYYYNLAANALRNLSRYNEAIGGYQKAIELNKNNKTAWLNLVNLFLVKGDKKDAHQYLEKALKIFPKDKSLLALEDKI